jgi:hypothetical protein
MRYTSDTWSVSLPDGWTSEESSDGVVLYHKKSEQGVFIINSFYKDDEQETVTNEDLHLFSERSKDDLSPVSLAFLTGLYCKDQDEEFITETWYLSSGSELIVVAYSIDIHAYENEAEEREFILGSLRSQYR